MPRFILIDSWLADVGGHNFQYALDVLQSAEEQGYTPVLAVNRSLPESARLPGSWNILRLFRFGMCSRYWLGPDGRRPQPFDLDGNRLCDGGSGKATIRLVSRIRDLLPTYDRRRRILDLARGCSELYDKIQPAPDDVLFLPSMSEADLVGVVRFLRDDPRSASFIWHLQFHFNFFSGRDPEFAKQSEVLRRIQRQFRGALDQIPEHQLRFYATTDQMVRQFDHIGVATFKTLPYPVRDLAAENESELRRGQSATVQPLRVTFAGAMRREKGRKQFGSLIAAVWPDCLAPGKMQFVFQAKPRRVTGWLPRELRGKVVVASLDGPDQSAHLRTVRHPLDATAYHDFIRQTDIGLFLYDSRRYFARASGILGEMLAAGIPAIVPAGCWLGDQICPQMYEHVESICQADYAVESQFVPLLVAAGEQAVTYQLPSRASDLAVQFECPEKTDPGKFFEIVALFAKNGSATVERIERAIVGPSSGNAVPPIGIMFPIPPDATQVRITFAWAYQGGPMPVEMVRVTALQPPAGRGHHPRSRVGLIATTENTVPALLREMAEHYDHYRQTAKLFSRWWLAEHHPRRTIDILTETTGVQRRGAEFAEAS